MAGWFLSQFHIWEGVVKGAALLLAAFFVLAVYARNRSFLALFIALITAGIFLWSINNVEWFQNRVGEDVKAGCKQSINNAFDGGVAGARQC